MKLYDKILNDTDYLITALREELQIVTEAGAIDSIFADLKKQLNKISMMPDNAINASKYQEHEIVDGLRKLGYEYKKPMGRKLHFFNRKTSISLYLSQDKKQITLQP
jgi:hypothetical protein